MTAAAGGKAADGDPVPAHILRKYLSYARQYIQPVLSREAAEAAGAAALVERRAPPPPDDEEDDCFSFCNSLFLADSKFFNLFVKSADLFGVCERSSLLRFHFFFFASLSLPLFRRSLSLLVLFRLRFRFRLLRRSLSLPLFSTFAFTFASTSRRLVVGSVS